MTFGPLAGVAAFLKFVSVLPQSGVPRRRGEMQAGEVCRRDVGNVTISNNPELPLKRMPPRDTWTAVKRGLRGRCPSCGRGHILHAYKQVREACPACGEEMHHHHADGFPPYITIFVVGYTLGATMLGVNDLWPNLPLVVHLMIWPSLCLLLSLWLLPRVKGGLVAYQWALRMHGFGTAHRRAPGQPPAVAAASGDQVIHRSAA